MRLRIVAVIYLAIFYICVTYSSYKTQKINTLTDQLKLRKSVADQKDEKLRQKLLQEKLEIDMTNQMEKKEKSKKRNEQIVATCASVFPYLIHYILYFINLIIPGFLELPEALIMSLTQFLLNGSGSLQQMFVNPIMAISNVAVYTTGYNLADIMTQSGEVMENGGEQLNLLTTNGAILQQTLVILLPFVMNFVRISRVRSVEDDILSGTVFLPIRSDTTRLEQTIRKRAKFNTNSRMLSWGNFVLSAFVVPELFPISMTFTAIQLLKTTDVEFRWLLFLANIAIIFGFGSSVSVFQGGVSMAVFGSILLIRFIVGYFYFVKTHSFIEDLEY